MKLGVKYAGGVLLAALLLGVVLWGKDLSAIALAITRASIPGLCLAAAVNLSHNVFRVMRWGLLLRPVRPQIPFRSRLSAVLIGYLTTWVIPGRLGELVRPALLSAREKLPLGPCLGSVVADRLLDGAAIVVLFRVGTLLAPLDAGGAELAAKIRTGSTVLVFVIAIVLALLLVAGASRARLSCWIEARSSSSVRWMGRTLLSLTEGTEALRQPRLLAPIVLHSFLAWGTIALGTWLGVVASGADVPFSAILVLLPPLALGVALPTPGGAGGFHAAMSLVLMHLFRVPEAVAISAGILMHLAVTIPVILAGIVFLWIDDISWRDLRDVGRRVSALGASSPPADCPAEAAR